MADCHFLASSDIASVLRKQILVRPNKEGSIILRERQAKMAVEIPDTPNSLIAIKLGRLGHLSMLGDGEWKRICDYLLITACEDRLYACFLELKKTLTERLMYGEQLRRSLPILEYLRSVCAIQFVDKCFDSERRVTYNVIASRQGEKIDKQRVRRDPTNWPDVERYRGIKVRRFVRSRIPVSKLL